VVCPIMSEFADPVARDVSDKRCGHGIHDPQGQGRGKITLNIIRRSSQASGQVPHAGIGESFTTCGFNETASRWRGKCCKRPFPPAFFFDFKGYDRLWFCLPTRRPEIVFGQNGSRPREAISRLAKAGGQKPNVL
jgi:hypothetical protein